HEREPAVIRNVGKRRAAAVSAELPLRVRSGGRANGRDGQPGDDPHRLPASLSQMTFVMDDPRLRSRTVPAGELLIWYCRLVRSDGCATEDVMKAYVATTGSVFALLVVAHIVRVMSEARRVATELMSTFRS